MDENQLLEVIKAERFGLFGKKLTDKTATALLRAAFRAVREQVQNAEEGPLKINGLGTFRIKYVERGEGAERVTRKVAIFRFKQKT
jgi:nucleoid DNA-binding protein